MSRIIPKSLGGLDNLTFDFSHSTGSTCGQAMYSIRLTVRNYGSGLFKDDETSGTALADGQVSTHIELVVCQL